MFCNAKQARYRSLLADVAYRQATSFALQTWSAVPRPTLVFGGTWRSIYSPTNLKIGKTNAHHIYIYKKLYSNGIVKAFQSAALLPRVRCVRKFASATSGVFTRGRGKPVCNKGAISN